MNEIALTNLDPAGFIVPTVPGVVSVTYNLAAKPPSTIEAV
jgi:GMP synthase PP-ATPase subunit